MQFAETGHGDDHDLHQALVKIKRESNVMEGERASEREKKREREMERVCVCERERERERERQTVRQGGRERETVREKGIAVIFAHLNE